MNRATPWGRQGRSLALAAVLGLTLLQWPAVHAQRPNGARPAERDAETACRIVPIVMAPRVYRQSDPRDWKSPRSETPLEPKQALYRSEPGLLLDDKACAEFDNGKDPIVFIGRGTWVAREDFMQPEQMERIHRWTTRYAFDMEVIRAGSYSEIGDERILTSGFEIDAYRVDHIRRNLHLFTPEGHWLDERDGYRRWELRRSPIGRVWVVDPTGKYLAAAEVFDRYYQPRCERDDHGRWTCGLIEWDRQSTCNVRVQADSARGCLEWAKIHKTGSPVSQEGALEGHYKVDVRTDKILIGARQTKGDIWSLKLYANFDDPIRPVIFKPGVLFQPHAKARKGRPPASELVMRNVCLADCPEQLVHQR